MKYFLEFLQKVIRSSTHYYKIHLLSFKALALTVLRYFAGKVKMPKITKGHNSRSIFQISSNINQVVYSLPQVYSSSFKALAPTVFDIFC